MMNEHFPKSEWGPGPWQDEPDHLAWTDERTSLACAIRRNMAIGSLCGYVGVPPTHPFFGWNYDDDIALAPGDLDKTMDDVGPIALFCYVVQGGPDHGTIPLGMTLKAHQGVNFSGTIEADGLWWFGFDCGHAGDMMPATDALFSRIMPPDYMREHARIFADCKYRDLDYVRREVTALAFQLRQLEMRVLLDHGMLKFTANRERDA
jgi:hypothetical protein